MKITKDKDNLLVEIPLKQKSYDYFVYMDKILPIILCRGGSKSVPRKNIKLLNGKPLLSYALTEALKVFPEVYVSTDDWEIKYVAENFGAKVIDRPPELADDAAKSVDAVKHALSIIPAEYVLLINACVPLLKEEDLRGVLRVFEDTGADSITTLVEDFSCHPSKLCQLIDGGKVFPVGKHPYRQNCAGCESCLNLKDNSWFKTGERQLQKPLYKRNTAIYLAKKEVIESGTFFGKDTRGYVMPKDRSWDINDEFDWKIAEFLIKQNGN